MQISVAKTKTIFPSPRQVPENRIVLFRKQISDDKARRGLNGITMGALVGV